MEFNPIHNCAADPAYIINSFCWIEDKVTWEWLTFIFRGSLLAALQMIANTRQVLVLKVRLLGIAWLIVCFTLWVFLFRQDSAILVFSHPKTGPSLLLEPTPVVHQRLPIDLHAKVITEDDTELFMGTIGSSTCCFSSTKHSVPSSGAFFALVDEVDRIPDHKRFLNAVNPPIAGRGRRIHISTTNKENPSLEFSRIWNGGLKGFYDCSHTFLPQDAHPIPDHAGYAAQQSDYKLYDPALSLVELYNHAFAVLLALEYSGYTHIFLSPFDQNPGRLPIRHDKVHAVYHFPHALRIASCLINSVVTRSDLLGIDSSTLSPTGGPQHEQTIAFINALTGSRW